jgi:hypothetical protein
MEKQHQNHAVIIVPTQGDNAKNFELVAKSLKQKVYNGKATIVKTTITGSGEVELKTHDGKAFSWGTAHHLSSVLTISHGFACDGPNLALLDDTVAVRHHQPWGTNETATCGELSDPGKSFWKSVSKALTKNGKIMLLGCSMGHNHYAQNVSKVTGKAVFASDGKFGAANEQTVLKHVQNIEKGKPIKPMKRFH